VLAYDFADKISASVLLKSGVTLGPLGRIWPEIAHFSGNFLQQLSIF
jgi:hypothetical protein